MSKTQPRTPEVSHWESEILRSIPDVVLRYDAHGLLEWASPSLEHVFGYRPAEVVGTRFTMSATSDRDRAGTEWAALVTGSDSHLTARYRVVKADGSSTWVEVTARREHDQCGQVAYLVAVLRELADRGDSDRFYSILADNTSDVVIVSDPAGVVVWASPSTTRMLGHRPVGIVGVSKALIHPQDRARTFRAFGEAIRNRETTVRQRARIMCATGDHLWMDISAVLLWSADGALEYVVSSLRDIDDQVRTEEALRDAVQRYQLLVENAHDVVYQVAGDGTLDWVSPSIIGLAGWQPEDLIGQPRLEYVHPLDLPAVRAAVARAQSGGAPTMEVRLRTADGRYRWVEISTGSVPDDSGAHVGVIRDVHARHEAQAALAASEQTFRSAMRDSAVGMCLLTPQGRMAEANRALGEFFGQSPQDLTGLTWQALADPAELEEDLENLRELSTGAMDSMRGIRHYRRADGTTAVGDLTISTIRGDDGSVTGFVVQIVDVTEQVRMQQQLAASEEHYRLLADSVSDVVVRSDESGVLRWVSRSVTQATGWQVQDILGRPFLDLVHPDDIEVARRSLSAPRTAGKAEVEIRIAFAEGGHRWFAVSTHPIIDAGCRTIGRVATWRDISGEIAARRLLAQREAEFREIAEHAADLVLRLDPADRITWASPSAHDLMGYLSRDLIGHDPTVFVHPDDIQPFRAFAHGLQPNIPARITLRARCADGDYRWFAVIATRIVDRDGEVVSQIIGMRNIDGEVRAVDALARSEEQFRLALISAPGGMAVVDLDGDFEQVNESLATMVGHTRDWLLRHALRDIVHPDDWPRIRDLHDRLVDGRMSAAMEEIRLVDVHGSTIWVESSLAVLREGDGPPVSFVAQFIDVTQAREARAALAHAATHDPLTRLGNRRGLAASLDSALSHTPRTGTRVGILALDLDGLKPVNDHHGHAAGDVVLVTVGERMRAAVRKDDPIARMGGDEFIVVLIAVHTIEQVVEIAEKIRESLSRGIPLPDGQSVRITASIGAVLAQAGDDADTLLRRADRALYAAKQAGRDQVVVERT